MIYEIKFRSKILTMAPSPTYHPSGPSAECTPASVGPLPANLLGDSEHNDHSPDGRYIVGLVNKYIERVDTVHHASGRTQISSMTARDLCLTNSTDAHVIRRISGKLGLGRLFNSPDGFL